MKMELTRENIEYYAARYKDVPKDQIVEDEMKPLLTTQRFLTKEQFVRLVMWKSTWPKKHYENNDAQTVEEITRFSFSAKTEQARIGSLFALNGVGFPVASVILHFAFSRGISHPRLSRPGLPGMGPAQRLFLRLLEPLLRRSARPCKEIRPASAHHRQSLVAVFHTKKEDAKHNAGSA